MKIVTRGMQVFLSTTEHTQKSVVTLQIYVLLGDRKSYDYGKKIF